MSTGRSNKPLFEVLSQHPPRGTTPHLPRHERGDPDEPVSPPRVEPKSAAIKDPKPARRPAPTPSPETDPEQTVSRPVVTIPLSTVYSAIALSGALILIAWIGGHKMGEASKERELIQSTTRPDILSEPGGTQNNTFQLPDQGSPRITSNQRTSPEISNAEALPSTPSGIQPSINGTILSPAGLLETDPRESGLNYLELGTFTREMTQDAIMFLAASNVGTIGIPQPSGEYRLISVDLGIPGSQWTALADQRADHQRRIAEVGRRWVRERQGGSDFTQPLWTKFQP